MTVYSPRFREQLIRGLEEDGLEELTVRLVRPRYPQAHRTGRGGDGGIDVLSDRQHPPERAWQCKTSMAGEAAWGSCRKSVAAAMAGDAPPKHYTFVFNHRLSEAQQTFWHDTLIPEWREAYPDLETIDYCDELASAIEDRPDVLDWLADGALATYVRTTLEQAAATGVNPLADAVDLSEGLDGVARHAEAVGAGDPRFAYGETGREADAGDGDLPDRVARFSITAGQRDSLPTFKAARRAGDRITEVTARPRDGAHVRPPKPWFADTPEGELARAQARARLARGESIVLEGPHVGLTGGDLPNRFAWPTTQNETGELELSPSEPLLLTVTLELPGVGTVAESIEVFQVPAEAGADMASAGAVGGTVLSLDFFPTAKKGPEGDWIECVIGVTLALEGESAHSALRGLGFARAFGEAEQIHLHCPKLLPKDGYSIPGAMEQGAHEAEIWEVAAKIALALDGLQRRDGVERTMPSVVAEHDLERADLVLHLLWEEEVVVKVDPGAEFPVPLPADAADGDLRRLLTLTRELPPLAGQATGLIVEQTVENATPLRIERSPRGTVVLICEAGEQGASIVGRTADHAS